MARRIAVSERPLIAADSAARSSRPYSSRKSLIRRAPTWLAATCASMSVNTMSGPRTFHLYISKAKLVGFALVVELAQRKEEALFIGVRNPLEVESAAYV